LKFLKIPARLITNKDAKEAELSGKEEEWFEGYALININEIEYICADEDISSIYFKSGGSIECTLNLDELSLILE